MTLSPLAATLALLIAGGLVAVGVFTGYPIATAFTVTGAVIGTGLALGGDPAWAKYTQIAALWVFTPIAGGGAAYLLGRLLTGDRFPPRAVVPALGGLVGAIVANIGFVLLGPPGETASIAGTVALELPVTGEFAIAGVTLGVAVAGVTLGVGALAAGALWWRAGTDLARTNREFLLAMGSLVAFSAGGSQVGLALGPLLPLLDPFDVSITLVLVGGGLGLLAGSWTGAPRMIKALSQDYSSLNPQLSIAALIPSFVIAQAAVFFGIPVSFNEIIVSAIVGSGFAGSAGGGGGVSREKALNTIGAWIGSLALALILGFGSYTAVVAVL